MKRPVNRRSQFREALTGWAVKKAYICISCPAVRVELPGAKGIVAREVGFEPSLLGCLKLRRAAVYIDAEVENLGRF